MPAEFFTLFEAPFVEAQVTFDSGSFFLSFAPASRSCSSSENKKKVADLAEQTMPCPFSHALRKYCQADASLQIEPDSVDHDKSVFRFDLGSELCRDTCFFHIVRVGSGDPIQGRLLNLEDVIHDDYYQAE